ncbi:MAG: hypothetical protein JNN13_16935 [Planctomycetes bacterium]|nr:hypothetical protein [Planctomycetota bacterium]
MSRATALALLALAAPLIAQGPPTLVPKNRLGGFVAEDVPKLRQQLAQSRLARLLAAADVAEAYELARRRFTARLTHTEALLDTADRLEVALDPWVISNRISSPLSMMEMPDLAELVRFELMASGPVDGEHRPGTAVVLRCTPRAEGRWTARFEQRAARMNASKHWQSLDEGKVDGYPGYAWAPTGLDENDPNFEFLRGTRLWMLHLPGSFASGSGLIEHCAEIASPPPPGPAALTMSMQLQQYVRMFADMGGGVPAEFAMLGFDTLQEFSWQLEFAGDQLLDTLAVRCEGEPKGLVGALLGGKAALPAQPLPEGALAQLRAAVDVATLYSALQGLAGGDLGPLQEADVVAAFSGGLAIGVTAPARGQLVPRIYLSLGIGDQDALARVLAALATGAKQKQVTYEDVPCTVLQYQGVPPAFQPTWCQLDGVLHIAETGTSMRAFLKARADGVAVMDVGDAPEPAGRGERLPFDVRFDTAAIYTAFHEIWLPLYEIAQMGRQQQPLLKRDEMPAPEDVAELLGKGRGLLRRDGDTWRLQQLGTLGGVETAALAMVYAPMLWAEMTSDYQTAQLTAAIGKHQLARIWQAIERWQAQHEGKLPASLGELVAQGGLPADALLLTPHDPDAEALPLPGDGGKSVPCSFRYFPTPVEVDTGSGPMKVLLVAIAPQPWNRAMLADDGTTPDVYGEVSRQPIDRFGK